MTTSAGTHRGVREVTLSDGAVVSLRRLKKSDVDGVLALHRQLTDREQYFFVADILADNRLMLQVLRDTGWQTTKRFDGAVLHVRIDLPARGGGKPPAHNGRGAPPRQPRM